MRYKTGEMPRCPHCGKVLNEAAVEDYCLVGKYGADSVASDSDCGYCDGLFSVERVDEDEYELMALAGRYGE